MSALDDLEQALEPQRLEGLKEAWRLFDQNGDGRITIDELATVLRAQGLNPSQAELQAMIEEVDLNGTGAVEWEEFLKKMAVLDFGNVEAAEEQLKAAFAAFDRNGDGTVDIEELKLFMTQLGDKLSDAEAEEMFKEADVNADGKISYDEFAKIMAQPAF